MSAESRYRALHKDRQRSAQVSAAAAREIAIALFATTGGLLSVAAAQNIEVDEKPYAYPNDTFITIDGTVESATREGFVLDYGGGEIAVEMDGDEVNADPYEASEGDQVSVYGMIDDGLFERRTIEAGGVYVERLNAHFSASSTDQEDDPERGILELPNTAEPGQVTLTGTVTDVDVNEEQFTLQSSSRSIEVTLGPTPGTPITEEDPGNETVQVGDRVFVRGRIDDDFFEGREIMADIVRLVGK